MFKQFKNIDTAFQFVRLFTILVIVAVVGFCGFVVYRSNLAVQAAQKQVYILLNGKLMDAISVDRSDSLGIEVKDHIKMFHYYFYSLEPDEEVNKKHLLSALYLADNTARQEYDNLMENGYYSSVISGNISQQVLDYDSIQVNLDQAPYYFRYFGKIRIVRATTITTRSLITEGVIRMTTISTRNPHGMLIERWKILENKDLTTEKRY